MYVLYNLQSNLYAGANRLINTLKSHVLYIFSFIHDAVV